MQFLYKEHCIRKNHDLKVVLSILHWRLVDVLYVYIFRIVRLTCTTYVCLVGLACCMSSICKAQVGGAILSSYLLDDTYSLIPAFAGTERCDRLTFGHRFQWVGIENAPAYTYTNYHQKVHQYGGVGGSIFRDANGFVATTGFQFTYAQHFYIVPHYQHLHYFSLALSYQGVSNTIDAVKLNTIRNTSIAQDPLLNTVGLQDFQSDLNFSVYYVYQDLTVATTISGFIRNFELAEEVFVSPKDRSILSLLNFTGLVGYKFKPSKNSYIQPTLMTNYNPLLFSVVEASVKYQQMINPRTSSEYFVVGGVRSIFEDQVGQAKISNMLITTGLYYDIFMFGYQFDLSLNELVTTSLGSHQFTIGMRLFCESKKR